MLNSIALVIVSTVGIVFFDDDPSSVSTQEWVLYAVLIYASLDCLRKFAELARRDRDGY